MTKLSRGLLLLLATVSTLCLAQPPPGPFGPPPFFGRPPPPWGRPWGPRGPPPPWMGRRPPPWRRPPWGRPPPPDFDGPPPPWMQPPPPPPPPQPIPPPSTPPPQPAQPAPKWIPRLQTLIRTIDQFNSVFSRPGQSYANVLNVLDGFYQRHSSSGQYDANRIELPPEVTGSELGPNKHIAGALFEADMILTVSQAYSINNDRKRRMLFSRAANLWPTTISYMFNEQDLEWRARILQALRHFEANTCLRFNEQSSQNGDYILFTRGEGCMSALGRLGGAQQVSIGYGCEQLGIVAHELAHTLGFWHEHSRPDRDSFLRVNRQNMINGVEGQFVKRSVAESDTQGLPFDYGSIMHYAANSYSRSYSALTLEPIDVLYRSTIGSRSQPTFLDYKHINLLYCSRNCAALSCQSGGYTDPNDCSRCKCPLGLGGRYCEQLQSTGCGMDLTADGYWRNISFSGSSDCYWRVRSPKSNLRIEFEATYVWFACAPSCEEYVELKWKNDLTLSGGRLCCHSEGGVRTTESTTLLVIARTSRSSQLTIRYRLQGGQQPTATAAPAQQQRRYLGRVGGVGGVRKGRVRRLRHQKKTAPVYGARQPVQG